MHDYRRMIIPFDYLKFERSCGYHDKFNLNLAKFNSLDLLKFFSCFVDWIKENGAQNKHRADVKSKRHLLLFTKEKEC